MRKLAWISFLSVLLLAACSDDDMATKDKSDKDVSESTSRPVLQADPVRYTRGLKLYQQYCSSCHGKQGEGAENWQKRDAQGKFLPPPLNGTGHTWHHPMHILVDIIKNGTQRLGGNMPPWKDQLTDEQIQDILFWVQSQWRHELYEAWYRNNEAVLANRKATRK